MGCSLRVCCLRQLHMLCTRTRHLAVTCSRDSKKPRLQSQAWLLTASCASMYASILVKIARKAHHEAVHPELVQRWHAAVTC
eukprot:509708-Amphidinium_carterae.2